MSSLSSSVFLMTFLFTAVALGTAPKQVGLCLKSTAQLRCFERKSNTWVQDMGNGLAAQTSVDEKELLRLEKEINSFRSWTKSELAKRPNKSGSCRFSAEFKLAASRERLCFDTIQGNKFESKIASVVKTLSSPISKKL